MEAAKNRGLLRLKNRNSATKLRLKNLGVRRTASFLRDRLSGENPVILVMMKNAPAQDFDG